MGHGSEGAKDRKGNEEALKFSVTVKIHDVVSHYDTV